MARILTAPKERKPGDTSKAKAQIAEDLGIALDELQGQKIAWVPVPMDTATRYLLMDVAAARNIGKAVTDHPVKVHAILHDLCKDALKAAIPGFQEEAKAVVRKEAVEKDMPALEKEMALLERKMAAAKAAMEQKLADAKAKKA